MSGAYARRAGFSAALLLTTAFLCTGLSPRPTRAGEAGTVAYSVQSDGDDQLYQIDQFSGIATPVGPVGFDNVEGLAYDIAEDILFGVDSDTDTLLTIDTSTGEGTAVGEVFDIDLEEVVDVDDAGLTYVEEAGAGFLYLTTTVFDDFLQANVSVVYQVDSETGEALALGTLEQVVTGLAAEPLVTDVTAQQLEGRLLGLGGEQTNNLVEIFFGKGATAVEVAPLGVEVEDGGLEFDHGTFLLFGIDDGEVDGTSELFSLDPDVTVPLGVGPSGIDAVIDVVAVVDEEGTPLAGFEGLAFAPPGAISECSGEISVKASRVNYGTIRAGTQRGRTFTITNVSDSEPLFVSVGEPSHGAFTVVNAETEYTLEPGESRTVRVRFAPGRKGVFTADLEIFSSDCLKETTVVRLRGNALARLRFKKKR